MELIREPVRVAAVFAPGRQIKPVWFDWRRKKYTVRETTYCWEDKAGDATLLHFSVSHGADLFELIYNTVDQGWTLGGVELTT